MRRTLLLITLLLISGICINAQTDGNNSMSLAPARFELEMQPGSERTVVLDLDYRSVGASSEPVRIVATLNDWSMTREGLVEFYPANTRSDSAASWMIYSPGEASVNPGTVHKIRVTVSVPMNAAPGDHMAALLIEQRPDTAKFQQLGTRQMIVRYRLASVFYIKVGKLTRSGDLYDLVAEQTSDGVVITPKIRNTGNSAIRPTAAVTVLSEDGKPVAEIPESETLPVLAGAELAHAVRIDKPLPPGRYTVKYRMDLQNGKAPVEGITELTVRTHVASAGPPSIKP